MLSESAAPLKLSAFTPLQLLVRDPRLPRPHLVEDQQSSDRASDKLPLPCSTRLYGRPLSTSSREIFLHQGHHGAARQNVISSCAGKHFATGLYDQLLLHVRSRTQKQSRQAQSQTPICPNHRLRPQPCNPRTTASIPTDELQRER